MGGGVPTSTVAGRGESEPRGAKPGFVGVASNIPGCEELVPSPPLEGFFPDSGVCGYWFTFMRILHSLTSWEC